MSHAYYDDADENNEASLEEPFELHYLLSFLLLQKLQREDLLPAPGELHGHALDPPGQRVLITIAVRELVLSLGQVFLAEEFLRLLLPRRGHGLGAHHHLSVAVIFLVFFHLN